MVQRCDPSWKKPGHRVIPRRSAQEDYFRCTPLLAPQSIHFLPPYCTRSATLCGQRFPTRPIRKWRTVGSFWDNRTNENCWLSCIRNGAIISASSCARRGSKRGRITKKASDKAAAREMRAEYDFSRGIRGKYARRYAHGTNVVLLEEGAGGAALPPRSRLVWRKFADAFGDFHRVSVFAKASPDKGSAGGFGFRPR